jgi:hypothetical protein
MAWEYLVITMKNHMLSKGFIFFVPIKLSLFFNDVLLHAWSFKWKCSKSSDVKKICGKVKNDHTLTFEEVYVEH